MTKKVNIDDLSEFDMAQYIQDDGDPGELAAALGQIAKARGMTGIAKASGIKREALYKALRSNSQPRFEIIQRVCKALGVKITVTSIAS